MINKIAIAIAMTFIAFQLQAVQWQGNLPELPKNPETKESHLGLNATKAYLQGCSKKAILNNSKMCVKIEALLVGPPDPRQYLDRSFLIANVKGNAKVTLFELSGPSAYYDIKKDIHCLGSPGLNSGILKIQKDEQAYSFSAQKPFIKGVWSLTAATKLHCKYLGHKFELHAVEAE